MIPLTSQSQFDSWIGLGLAGLSSRHWAAFAADAGERQIGTYQYFARQDPQLNSEVLRMSLDLVWAYVEGGRIALETLDTAIERLEQLIPDFDDPNAPEQAPLVLEAVAAVVYALQSCRFERPEYAISAGHSALNAVHDWVDDDLRPEPIKIALAEIKSVQDSIDGHPLMMRELQVIQDVVKFLREHPVLDGTACSELRKLGRDVSTSNIGLS